MVDEGEARDCGVDAGQVAAQPRASQRCCSTATSGSKGELHAGREAMAMFHGLCCCQTTGCGHAKSCRNIGRNCSASMLHSMAFVALFFLQSRQERAARIAAFEAKHGADWEQKLVTAEDRAVL